MKSEDCISREEALVKVRGYLTDYLPLDSADEIDEIIKALEPTRWIPVSERLPELDVNINVYEKKNPIMVSKPVYISYRLDGRDYVCPVPCILHSNGYWYNDAGSLKDWVQLDDYYDGGADLPISLEVTAWMPLPEPYKAESEE